MALGLVLPFIRAILDLLYWYIHSLPKIVYIAM